MTDTDPTARRNIGKKIVFAGVTLALFVVFLEVGLRINGYGDMCVGKYAKDAIWACDPLLYFKLNPELNVNGQTLNGAGFRGREFSPKPRGVYRILALGDSCTFGITTTTFFEYIPMPYPQRLEQIVAERTGPVEVEVLNAGVPGYNSFQGVMLMRTKLRGLRPDLVTVRFGWNDHFMSRQVRGDAFREPDNVLLLDLQDLLLRTALYPSIRRLQQELDASRQVKTPSKPTLADAPHEWKPNVPLDQYKHNLQRIAEIARARGAQVWFLTSPTAFVTDENRGQYDKFPQAPSAKQLLTFNAIPSFERLIEIHDSYNAATREVGAELGVAVIDMDALYRQHSSEHLFTTTDVLHPTQQGHNLEAEALYGRLVTEGIVRPKAPVPISGS